jgi:hypothetical protein
LRRLASAPIAGRRASVVSDLAKTKELRRLEDRRNSFAISPYRLK